MRIVDASFITSASNLSNLHLKDDTLLEVAFIGRSNVGKSTLLNAICNHKGLAKSSSTPGKTRLINYFGVTFMNEDINGVDIKKYAHFVDLPGFGYAKVSKSLHKEWQKSLNEYIQKRKTIKLFIHLIDARHPFLDIDKEVNSYIRSICDDNQQILEVFTKIDKLKQKETAQLNKSFPNALKVSSSKKKGINILTNFIYVDLFGNNE